MATVGVKVLVLLAMAPADAKPHPQSPKATSPRMNSVALRIARPWIVCRGDAVLKSRLWRRATYGTSTVNPASAGTASIGVPAVVVPLCSNANVSTSASPDAQSGLSGFADTE